MQNRQDAIHNKGFSMSQRRMYDLEGAVDYGKMKVGTKTVEDAILNLGSMAKVNKRYANKAVIYKALAEHDLPLLREISNYFYTTNGIYSRVCDYYANLYRYDWYTVPEILDESVKEEKVLKDFNTILNYLDNSHIKKLCGEIALEVILNGAYYGYKVPCNDKLVLQQLPASYCRSRFFVGDDPLVEFNMKFFDEQFKDMGYRLKVIKMFPAEFQKGYMLYKAGKLQPETAYDRQGSWYTLEPGSTIKFSLNAKDIPIFVNAIPALIDLDTAQDLDQRKQMQQLQKIIVQKLPLDKNGDLIFDVDEARDIHNNAVEMLEHSIGTDVLTTFADITVEDVGETNANASSDTLERMERAAYNAFGTSRNLFNTDGNLSLEKSILDDESAIRSLLFQMQVFFDNVCQAKAITNKRKYNFRLYMLETTQYNYQTLSKMYKEQVQIGYSKMLPQIAMGHSQSSIIHSGYFENKVMDLGEIMIPPLMSSTMNADTLRQLDEKKQGTSSNSQNTTEGSSSSGKTLNTDSKSAGRPEKEDGQKSEKTIQNKESMS